MSRYEDKLRAQPVQFDHPRYDRPLTASTEHVRLTRQERDALADAVEAARVLHHFLYEEKETREPSHADLDLGYVALESSADYEREEQLGDKLMAALARLDATSEKTPD